MTQDRGPRPPGTSEMGSLPDTQEGRDEGHGTFTAAQGHGKGSWYFVSRWFCVLCGHSVETRERRYDERPTDPAERQEYVEGACGVHFS